MGIRSRRALSISGCPRKAAKPSLEGAKTRTFRIVVVDRFRRSDTGLAKTIDGVARNVGKEIALNLRRDVRLQRWLPVVVEPTINNRFRHGYTNFLRTGVSFLAPAEVAGIEPATGIEKVLDRCQDGVRFWF